MNLFQLVTKQMRQRALSTWLTLLSVSLGVGLAVAILLFQRESGKLFGQTDFGYDLLIGAPGSKTQLVMNTVYNLGDPIGTIPYSVYEGLPGELPENLRGGIAWKVPYHVGDFYEGHRVIGTLPQLFGHDEQLQPLPPEKTPQYRADRSFKLAQGKVFHPRKFEAVVGADVAAQTRLALGSSFKIQHAGTNEEHDEQWTVVGILAPTHTAADRLLFIPLESFYAIPDHQEAAEELAGLTAHPAPPAPAEEHDEHDEHAEHAEQAEHANHAEHVEHAEHEDHAEHVQHAEHAETAEDESHAEHAGAHHHHEHAYHMNADGTFTLHVPREHWRITSVLVHTRGGFFTGGMMWAINNRGQAMAVSPAMEMASFFNTFLQPSTNLLLLISVLVIVVAAVSILVSIYNSIVARRREIAILRALGATRLRVVALICVEAGLIGLLGGVVGLLIGHGLGALSSIFLRSRLGEGINWVLVGGDEWLYLLAVCVLAVLAGLVPAMKAYRTPVARNLVASA